MEVCILKMDRNDVNLYLLSEPDNHPRIQIFVNEAQGIFSTTFSGLSFEQLGNDFIEWFESQFSSPVNTFNFTFFGESEKCSTLFFELNQIGARFSLVNQS